ncbi:uncharacterized protein LOC110980655 [Acanthaster planci]|uniref:Uncharacterized protein LOC110980655 n=1 Tax=Acanthaster planci TaxID=133434 RepID=A0A8B7YJ04_ACAPL|nr:uncharacterized protein LOC110980655 [Acanthaster planci]
MERIAIDLTGRLPRTKARNTSIMVVADHFTKWVEAFPLPDQTAETVAKRSSPTAWSNVHPQSDSMVERFNRTVKTMLSMFVDENQDDWDEHLPYVLMAYCSSQHDSTRLTPNMLMLGREFAWRHLRRTQSYQKQQYDRRAQEGGFEPGQAVWLFTPKKKVGHSPKLQPWWDRSFAVLQRLNDVTYKVQRSVRAKAQIVHLNRLKRYLGDVQLGWWERTARGALAESSEEAV